MDCFLDGNILGSMDVISQRMKSLELPATRLDAALALQVEITPREILGLTGDSEVRYAYQEYMGENRLVRQLTGPREEEELPSHRSWSPRSESLNMIPLDEGPLCGVECGRTSAPGFLPMVPSFS